MQPVEKVPAKNTINASPTWPSGLHDCPLTLLNMGDPHRRGLDRHWVNSEILWHYRISQGRGIEPQEPREQRPRLLRTQNGGANFMPLFHAAGCATEVFGCLQAACKMLLIKRFDARAFARLIEEQSATTCFAAPAMLFGLLEALDETPRDMSSLEVITTGDAPVPPNLVRCVRDRLGYHLLSAFGQTEHSPTIYLNPIEATQEQIVQSAGQPLGVSRGRCRAKGALPRASLGAKNTNYLAAGARLSAHGLR